ncbi:ENTP4 diphosphohydrolase, partial [Aphelocoma coerulescens]|nr:ENTP4 diphosphohydrolase [Aphelocoma coerulescens]
RISISCLLPASWHFSLSPVGCPRILSTPLRQLLLLGAAALLLCSLLLIRSKYGRARDRSAHRYLARVTDTEATDTKNPNLNYGIVVDCGSSGSRIFVYCWPQHNGNPHELLDIQQMRDSNRRPVVMKIKPALLIFHTGTFPWEVFSHTNLKTSRPVACPVLLLIPIILFPVEFGSQQKAILEDLLTDIPVHFDFLFSDSHAEVISGKQEGVYAWIGINFVLGRFEHTDDEDEAMVEVQIPGSERRDPIFRKRTVGILDMGGVSTQIAYEVPQSVSVASPQQEEVAKNLLAEFNLGCDAHQTEHVYRVYVATFLGFGGNAARQRYEDSLFSSTLLSNRYRQFPWEFGADPSLEVEAQNLCIFPPVPISPRRPSPHSHRCIFQFLSDRCSFFPRLEVKPALFRGVKTLQNRQRNTLSTLGWYRDDSLSPCFPCFPVFPQEYCATRWSVLRQRFERGLYASHADLHRLKFQCFKSAWMFEVFHRGFSFPESYGSLKTALQVYDKEVQWTLGAILYRTRFLPLRDIQQENFRGSHSHWRSFSFVYNHHLFSACFLVVLLSILLYLLRLRRIHRASSPALWIPEKIPIPQKIPGPL